jgi:outer membrane lipoprotein-sorting protein
MVSRVASRLADFLSFVLRASCLSAARSARGIAVKLLICWVSIWLLGGLAALGQTAKERESIPQLVSRMEAMAAQLEDYEVLGDEVTDGTIRFKLSFKRPNLVRIDTDEGQVTMQPNGEIRGRLGHGLFGRFSRKLRRDDARLKTGQGILFWESHYAATVARIKSQIQAGATASLAVTPKTLELEIREGPTLWRYVIDPVSLFFQETSRTDNGKRVAVTHFRTLRTNVGLETRRFEF